LAPDTVIDLHERKALVVEPGRHVDLALLCLAARYIDGHAVVLPKAERCDLPPRVSGQPILGQLYGDVLDDASAAVGRALLARGLDNHADAIDVSNIAPALADPKTYVALAESLDGLASSTGQPLVGFAAGIAPNARRFAELLMMLRHQMRQLLEAAGRPATDEAVERLTEKVVAGRAVPVLRLVVLAALRGRLPAADPAVTTELRAMRDQLRSGWRDAVEQQVVVDVRRADPAQVFDALDALQSRRTG
jgi:hypothetical protein